MLRSTPFGLAGAGGTSPLAMRSVQSASCFSVAGEPIVFNVAYIELPRTPPFSRRSHASTDVWTLESTLCNVIQAAGELVAELMAEVAAGLQLVDPKILSRHLSADAVALRSRAGKRLSIGSASMESQ